jgi:hypothetical protein
MIFCIQTRTATAGPESQKRRWDNLHDTVYLSLNFIEIFVKNKEQKRYTSTETGCSLFYLSNDFLLLPTCALPYLSEHAIDMAR